MKKRTILFPIIVIMLFVMNPFQLHAQNDQSKRTAVIKIIKTENGNTVQIDTIIELKDDTEIQDLFEESGIGSELKILDENGEMEIIIKKTDEENDTRTYNITLNEDKVKWDNGSSRAFLGIFMKPAEGETQGVLVDKVVENSAAEKAGLQKGDVIINIDGNKIESIEDLKETLKNRKPNDQVNIKYLRNGKKQSAKVTLGERKNEMRSYMFNGDEDFDFDYDFDMEDMQGHAFMWKGMKEKPFLGVGIEDAAEMEESKSEKGVYINKVYEESAAEEAGLKTGDVIIKINDQDIESSGQLIEELGKFKAGESIKVTYLRDGKKQEKTIELKAREMDMKGMMPHFRMKMDGMQEEMKMIKENLKDLEDEIQKIEDEALKDKLFEKLNNLQENLKGRQGMIMENMGHCKDMSEIKCLKGINMEDTDIVKIMIQIDDVSDEEAGQLKINNTNDLSIDELTFSPNPGDGHFQLSFTLPEEGKTTIRVFDMQGNEVYKEKLNRFSGNYNGTLDISEQAKGVYFLNVEQNGKSISKKMIIQ
jgi:C-terminal processing protease CtpA/Prc